MPTQSSREKGFQFNRPCMLAALLAPCSIPVVGLLFSLFQPMPDYPIAAPLDVFEYVGLFALGTLVFGFPLGVVYGYPVLRFTSGRIATRASRLAATMSLGLIPPLGILIYVGELNYFTSLCLVMSVTTALCAQLLLFRMETIGLKSSLKQTT